MNDLISVIIPVYKAETYLHTCVDSVLSQSHCNLEVILVDDGSPDNCPSICDSYKEKDNRVSVIHKENGGASSARNAGLDIATGEYITFVDSDDIVPPNGLETLYEAISRTNAGYAAGICKIKNSSVYKNNINKEQYIEFNERPEKVLGYITGSGSYSPYAKLYKGDIIKNGIRFDETLKCSEDALFVRQYLAKCESMVLVPREVYEYNTTNDNSLSKKGYEMYCEYYIEKLKALEELCGVLPLSDEKKKDFIIYRAIHGLRVSTLHYIKCWKSVDEQKRLIKKCVNLFGLWLDFSDRTLWFTDKETAFWWKTKRDLISQNHIDEYYKRVCLDEKKKRYKLYFIICMKKIIKKIIRKQV